MTAEQLYIRRHQIARTRRDGKVPIKVKERTVIHSFLSNFDEGWTLQPVTRSTRLGDETRFRMECTRSVLPGYEVNFAVELFEEIVVTTDGAEPAAPTECAGLYRFCRPWRCASVGALSAERVNTLYTGLVRLGPLMINSSQAYANCTLNAKVGV